MENLSNLNKSSNYKIENIRTTLSTEYIFFKFDINLRNRTGEIHYSIVIMNTSGGLIIYFERLEALGSDKNKINSTEHEKMFSNDTSLVKYFNNLIGVILMKIFPIEVTNTDYKIIVHQ